MKQIPLTQGKYAIVDDQDFDLVSKYKWHFSGGYAKNKGKKSIYMHRVILNAKEKEYIDHKNHNKLDNRRVNLRICTQSQNLGNQRLNKLNTSGYKGVSWHKTLKYWVAGCKLNGKTCVKYFKTKKEAILGYNEMAIKLFGDFAYLNKI